jgi:2-iminobutanoate/2-iminopropanoate deaminase
MKHEIIGGALALADGRPLPLSKAVRAGDYVFVSGQLGITHAGALAGNDVEAQTRQCLQNIAAILAEAGCGLDHVIKTTVWLVERADFPRFNQVYAEFFAQHPPARATVVADLVIAGALVEIEALAYAP